MMPEYIDYAQYYDRDHQDTVSDFGFYLQYAQQCGSPVLELACGTGRLLVPLADSGLAMWGVDISENMLAVCKQKVAARHLTSQVNLVQGSMADYELPRKDFALAFIAFRSFMHLYSQADQLACLSCTYRHLRPGGLLIIDIYAPLYPALAKKPDGPFIVRREFDLVNGHHVIRKDRFIRNDPLQQIQYTELQFEEYNREGVLVHTLTIPLSTRYTFHFEMQLLLEKVGFELIDCYKDFDRTPFDGTGEIITVARKPRKKDSALVMSGVGRV